MKTVRGSLFAMAVLLLLWGSFAMSAKLALRSLDNFQVLFYMFAAATVIMAIPLLGADWLRSGVRISRKQWAGMLLRGVLCFLYYLFYILALRLIPAVEASMLNYLFPVFLVAFSLFLKRESLSLPKTISLLCGFTGMVVIVTNGSLASIKMTNWQGDLLAIGAAFCWAAFSILAVHDHAPRQLSSFTYALVSTVLSGLSMLVFSEPAIPDASGFGWSLWLGLSNIVLTYWLWFRCLNSLPSALVASLSFLTPFITLTFLVVLLGESISIPQLVGLLIIVAGCLVQISLRHRFSGRGGKR